MIIRTPTRTKTKSFNGSQVDFKFPSTESLPRGKIEEEELNNHHLLNVTLKKGRDSSYSQSSHHDESDNVSQILSDYTSASNTNSNAYTNSSNGYYSFANISDNTTSPRFFTENKDGPISNLNLGSPGRLGNYPATLAPEKTNSPISTPSLKDKKSSNSLRSSITSKSKSIGQSQMASIPENKLMSVHTVNASIPTADNISYEIISATSNISHTQPRINSTVSSSSASDSSIDSSSTLNKHATVKKHPMTVSGVPSIKNVQPSKGVLRSLSVSRTPSLNSRRSRNSKLKRSNAIRCKGGLLAYFTSIGIRMKRTLRKIRIALRRKLFSFNGSHSVISRSSSMSNKIPGSANRIHSINYNNKKNSKKNVKGKHNMAYSNSINNGLTTSHLKRTDGYVTNLRRTISQSQSRSSSSASASPKPITKLTPPGSMSESVTNIKDNKMTDRRTTLRRTNSSIRRAASILTATPSINRLSTAYQTDPKNASNGLNLGETPSSHLTRSKGMPSLNSVIREPSIVVKNKVIPLSMGQYPIKEEDEYIIDTNSMQKRNSTASLDTDNSSYFEANHEKSSIYSENEEDETDDSELDDEEVNQNETMDMSKMTATELSDLFSHYYKNIISRRIMMRLQMGQYQNSNNLTDVNNEYMHLLEKFVSEYESESSDMFDQESKDTDTSSESSEDDSNSQFSFDANEKDLNNEEAMDIITPLQKKNKTGIQIKIETPFAVYSASQNASLLSIPTDAIKRSLTLPIGITI
ncbi:similar to Saccharomyces cerevisiae YPL158C AIM44 Protein of unknown function [Maudiozyma saulgeensis]|uniref:Altered inheritance of mitochondria protein 44 n=1 Tax=Maudiozyma saulgeensis TaxID=1789683 RepID=A0A1X7R937_9SACH|nr:similar to Saccharomyces cerevisiae YPL158C AIM44 Protein of unknown function [Kazachstania saulgeensis]